MMTQGWIVNRPIAHRGLHDGKSIFENTLEAFDKAASLGYPVELDVQLTSDNEIIVFHDFNLIRLTGMNIRTSEISKSRLKKLNILTSDQRIPLIDEVFELIGNRVPILIELKNFQLPGMLERLVTEKLTVYKGDFAIQSFNPLSLLWIKKRNPGIMIGQLGSGLINENVLFLKKLLSKHLFMQQILKPDFIGYDISGLPNKLVRELRTNGTKVLAWTVKNDDERVRAGLYADNYIFERLFP